MATFWAILVGLANATLLYSLLFKDFDDFVGCIKLWCKPDIISIFQGKWQEDYWARTKVLVWLGLSLAVGILTYINIK